MFKFRIKYFTNNVKIEKFIKEERYVKPILNVLIKYKEIKDIQVIDNLNNKWKAENYLSQEN